MRRALVISLIGLLVLVLVGTLADLVVKSVAQDRLAAYVRLETGAHGASVRLYSFPFLARVLLSGRVETVDIRATSVPAGPVTLSSVTITAHDVRLDRGLLIRDQRVRVLSVASADIALRLAPSTLSAVLGRTVTIGGRDELRVDGSGATLPLHVTVESGKLLLVTAAGVRLGTVDLSVSPVVPPCPLKVSTDATALTLSCHLSPVPPSLLSVFSDSG